LVIGFTNSSDVNGVFILLQWEQLNSTLCIYKAIRVREEYGPLKSHTHTHVATSYLNLFSISEIRTISTELLIFCNDIPFCELQELISS